MMNKLTPLAFGLTLAISGIANAEDFRQHDAHVHGQVEFNIAQDGNELLVEITAPGADVVGFEHAPKTDEQKHKIEDVIAQLNQPSSIFTLASSAGCQLEHKSVTHTLGEGSHQGHDHNEHDDHAEHDHDKHEHHDDHAEHDHDKREHHDDHAEHDHDKHEHHDDHAEHDHDKHEHHDDHAEHDHDKHEHHDDHEGGHGEFTIEYHYDCSDISKLNTIETQWFQHFPTTESIRANILTDAKQAALDLRQGQTKIEL